MAKMMMRMMIPLIYSLLKQMTENVENVLIRFLIVVQGGAIIVMVIVDNQSRRKSEFKPAILFLKTALGSNPVHGRNFG